MHVTAVGPQRATAFDLLWIWLQLMWLQFEVVRGPVGVVWAVDLGPVRGQSIDRQQHVRTSAVAETVGRLQKGLRIGPGICVKIVRFPPFLGQAWDPRAQTGLH